MGEIHVEHRSAYLNDSIQVGDASVYGEYYKTDCRETIYNEAWSDLCKIASYSGRLWFYYILGFSHIWQRLQLLRFCSVTWSDICGVNELERVAYNL